MALSTAARCLGFKGHAARGVVSGGRRSASSLASLVSSRAKSTPDSLALAAPMQGVEWSFAEMDDRASHLAAALTVQGYSRGQVVVSNLPNSAENLLLQVACSYLGVAVATVKDEAALEDLAKVANVQGSVVHLPPDTPTEPFLKHVSLPIQPQVIEELDGSLCAPFSRGSSARTSVHVPDGTEALGYWSSTKPLTNNEALDVMGAAAKSRLSITEKDRVLVSITLCHAFGIGSAVGGAWLGGAAVVLPGASGIRGCGSPSQRAEATLSALESQSCSLLFADVHTLKALPAPGSGGKLAALRGGVCKVGSGADFLEDVREAKIGPDGELRPLEYAGVPILALGKKS